MPDLESRAAGGELQLRADPALVLAVTAAQRMAAEAALRRRDLAPQECERVKIAKAAALTDAPRAGAPPSRQRIVALGHLAAE